MMPSLAPERERQTSRQARWLDQRRPGPGVALIIGVFGLGETVEGTQADAAAAERIRSVSLKCPGSPGDSLTQEAEVRIPATWSKLQLGVGHIRSLPVDRRSSDRHLTVGRS
jgi:hypothetical protein